MRAMLFVKGVLVGLAAAILLTAAVLALEMTRANRAVRTQLANCGTGSNEGGAICSAAVQVGGVEVPAVFAVGFVAGYAAWFYWPKRLD